MSSLPPREAVALAVARLQARGFVVVARNERGDSLYLALAGHRFRLRVSNHARRPRQRRTHAEVLASLVIDGPRSEEQVERLVEAVVRDFTLRADRLEPA